MYSEQILKETVREKSNSLNQRDHFHSLEDIKRLKSVLVFTCQFYSKIISRKTLFTYYLFTSQIFHL